MDRHGEKLTIEQAAQDAYDAVFAILDNIPELTGDDAGRVATAAQETVKQQLTMLLRADGMPRIYVYRNPKDCPYPFAEVQDGFPVHPGDLQARVRELLASGQPWATTSEIVMSMLGWMLRKGDLSCPVHLVYVAPGQDERVIRYDVKGDFIEVWPENGFGSIMDADFHYRFA